MWIYLYFIRKQAHTKGVSPFAKGRDDRLLPHHTRLPSFQWEVSIQISWITPSLLQEVWHASYFADSIPKYSGAPSRVCMSSLERGSHSVSSPQSQGIAQHRAVNSSHCLCEGCSNCQLISCTSEGRNVTATFTASTWGLGREQLWEGTGELWTLESIFQLFPSRLLLGWDLLIT